MHVSVALVFSYMNSGEYWHTINFKPLICELELYLIAFSWQKQEGPMIHSGAVIAAGISQGRSDTFRKFDLRVSILN